ncbi:methyltransferase [Ktedonobacter sp. SOSP1-85]|uniref:class I SAM-dependent methyltransferase n=1 Tax=Ktedonobacter sp. SOSP1-85 TaxID=2778367 RepID=UPI00191669A4|nr:methyltransferase domain-containing protein [Ktedonobacter sp. SOSP1-85]GHO81874.1 methyltransferase [Ktedonobacter sp. SOSP1-85]
MSQEQNQPIPRWQSPEVAHDFRQEAEQRQQSMEEATRHMLLSAGLKPGDRVLDIAAGTGEQSLLAARLVGPTGWVLSTDISADMLQVAASRAQQEKLTNISTQVMDAAQLDLDDKTFDAVICRNGLMMLGPRFQQALSEIHRVLKPSRKLAALVWSVPERNPLHALPLALLAKYIGVDPSNACFSPGPFSLADKRRFEQALADAGFRDVAIQAIPLQLHFASVEAYLESRRLLTASMIGQLSESDQQQLTQEIREVLSQFEGPQGLVTSAETLLGVGTR